MAGMSSTAETGSAPWAALPVVLLAQFLAVADFFVVNVALPSIAAELRAGPAVLQFIVAGYGLAYACGLVAAVRVTQPPAGDQPAGVGQPVARDDELEHGRARAQLGRDRRQGHVDHEEVRHGEELGQQHHR